MTRFELLEILPDVALSQARLYRRSAGSSSRETAVTLLADYSLRTRAWLPSAAVVALLEESAVSTANARTTLSRLARRDVLESSRAGRRTSYRLTEPAAAVLAIGGMGVVSYPAEAERWDGSWTVIAFSVPTEGETQRRALRGRLRWQGYAPLYDGLWVSPEDSPARTALSLTGLDLGAVTVFRARQVELETVTSRPPLDAWDLPNVAREFESFIRHWSPLLPRIRSGDVGGAEAVRARTQVMDVYRRFVVLDPRLPLRMMPSDWPRARAREVFTEIYDGLAAPAERHVRDVVARLGDGTSSGIGAHTIADLVSGVRRISFPGGPPPRPCQAEPATGDDAGRPPPGADPSPRR
ncbi:MAG: PaaX family transcriptional regulator [Actinomycetales bacterium]|nr:PaaX family transcriptional regulator [Actinomycetales bacterium]